VNTLNILADHRNALLLAEVAAWLHDMGKCADEHIVHQASNTPQGHRYQYKKAHSGLLPSEFTLNLLGESVPLLELVEKAKPGVGTNRPWLLRVLGRCHGAAHIEKEETDETGKQPQDDTRLSDAFGREFSPLTGLTGCLKELPLTSITDRTTFQRAVKEAFTTAPGDTRRPENEVTLWDWSSTVAAMYKAALAGALLDYKPEPRDLHWRLLSVRVDERAFYGNVAQLPDLLARRQLLSAAFERVRELLEETYPLGTRVYQDESSSLYVVPNLPDLLNLTDSQGTTLDDLIHTEFAKGTVNNKPQLALAGEMIAHVELDAVAWWGQRPEWKNCPATEDEVPPIAAILQAEVFTHADAQIVAGWWDDAHRDICPVCGLRPQANPETKAGRRKVCDVCEQRRANRAQAWAGNLSTTIWTDEIADINGRLALIVGQFDLRKWLDGTMVKTLLVTDSKSGNAVTKKHPSFARLRRIWETTRTFWQSALDVPDPGGKPVIQPVGPRLVIEAENIADLGLTPYHAYELVLGPTKLSVLRRDNDLITLSNLRYASKQLGAKSEQFATHDQAATFVRQCLEKHGPFEIEEPTGYGSPNKLRGRLSVSSVRPEPTTYNPVIPILAEPRTFMALVPADRALAIVQAIKAKYEREMSKVRNRLPLTLGAVYFGRRTPLAAALGTGRRMLAGQHPEQNWTVESVDPPSPRSDWPAEVTLALKQNNREISVTVRTVMGDGTTEDVWYPYWRVDQDANGVEPPNRTRRFTGPDGEQWVRVCDLKKGDTVGFTPSTFDYEFLDTTARRFEVSYTGGHRRGADKYQRPYLLEEIEQIEQMWSRIKPLENAATSQIKALIMLIETKRVEWKKPTGSAALALPENDPFRWVCNNALATTAWRGKKWSNFSAKDKKLLERAAISGILADAVELHLTIAKEDDREEAS